ncbi:PIN domain-containing protein [Thermus thalpophilus]
MGGRVLKGYLLDTSLLLRLLTGEPPELAARALEVFRGAEEGRYTLVAHPLVVAEAFYTLVSFYGAERAKAARALLDLLDRPGIVLEEEEDLRAALENAGKGGLSLVDLFLAHKARRQGEGIASLDEKLRKRAGVALLPP